MPSKISATPTTTLPTRSCHTLKTAGQHIFPTHISRATHCNMSTMAAVRPTLLHNSTMSTRMSTAVGGAADKLGPSRPAYLRGAGPPQQEAPRYPGSRTSVTGTVTEGRPWYSIKIINPLMRCRASLSGDASSFYGTFSPPKTPEGAVFSPSL